MEQISSTSVSNLTPSASHASRAAGAWPHVAFLRVSRATHAPEPQRSALPPDWLVQCYRSTPRVQPLSATAALLDLAICTEAEALGVVTDLLRRLAHIGLPARVGMAPSAALAQFALLAAPSHQQVATVLPQDIPSLVRRIPVAALAQLLPSAVPLETVARLRRYGLHTLGHIATLPANALAQQFGDAGAALAALAQGRDPLPFSPTPLPPRLCFRMRFPSAAIPAERVLAALPAWVEQITATLRDARLTTRELRLVLHWEHGSQAAARTILRQHTHDPALLLAALRGLLVPLLQQQQQHHRGLSAPAAAHDESSPGAADALLDAVRLTLLDLAPLRPRQEAFWHVRPKHQAALDSVAATLARRHGHALIFCARRAAATAIFPEERYRLHTVAPISAPETKARRQPSPSPLRSAPTTSSAWEEVPHRLHWW